jgi:prevent-host-death family protein
MREIQSSEAKTHLAQLLDAVEEGEVIVITRHGRPIARLVPEADQKRANVMRAIADLRTFKATMPPLTLEEILSARHEGHRY